MTLGKVILKWRNAIHKGMWKAEQLRFTLGIIETLKIIYSCGKGSIRGQ